MLIFGYLNSNCRQVPRHDDTNVGKSVASYALQQKMYPQVPQLWTAQMHMPKMMLDLLDWLNSIPYVGMGAHQRYRRILHRTLKNSLRICSYIFNSLNLFIIFFLAFSSFQFSLLIIVYKLIPTKSSKAMKQWNCRIYDHRVSSTIPSIGSCWWKEKRND